MRSNYAKQGITVLDRDLRLLAWNQAFIDLYDMPPNLVHVGISMEQHRHATTPRADPTGHGRSRNSSRPACTRSGTMWSRCASSSFLRQGHRDPLEPPCPMAATSRTYTDVTDTVLAEEASRRANETLEQRVRERTEELTRLNEAFRSAKAEADEANISKTRFLAAASHDILQPLNAARLYATSLVERDRDAGDATSPRTSTLRSTPSRKS